MKQGESYKEYGRRLYKNRDLYGINNDVAGFLINEAFPEKSKGESAHRKHFASYLEGYDDGYAEGLKDVGPIMERESSVKGLNSLVPKTHLDRFSELIGEYGIRKRDMQLERNELAKMSRKITPWLLLTEQYAEALREPHIELPDFEFDRIETDGEAVIKVLPSDWHVGCVVDESYNQFNYEIAVRRVDLYCKKILEEAKRENAHTISITHLGDIIEGIEMRSNQKWDCEFLLKDQLKYAQRLFMRMIKTLSKEYNVEVCGVYGNHDRLVGDKHKSIGKDSAMAVIIENLQEMIAFSEEEKGQKMERITFLEADDEYKSQAEEIYGIKCRWQHGHEDSKNDERKIEKYNGVDETFYNVLGFGHLHHGRVIRKNRNNFEMYGGGLMGSNEYGKSKVKSLSDASQGIIVFRDNGDVIPFEINLQNA